MANIATSKSNEKILKLGGFLYWVPWEEDKAIDDVYVAELVEAAASGATGISVDQVTAFPATGTININGETAPLAYTAITGTDITLAALTAAHSIGEIVEVVQATGATITSYSGFSCLGYSSGSMFNAGIGESESIITESGDVITGFAPPDEPTFTVTLDQADIDSLGFMLQKDIEASTENGATVIKSTSTFKDIAAIYVAISVTPSGAEKVFVIKFPHLQRSGSEDINFDNDLRQVALTFKVMDDKTDGYKYKILHEE